MSDTQGAAKGFIDQLVVKAIEKKKHIQKNEASKNKPKLEYVLFSQFDVLDTLPSKNGRTTVYHLAKKDRPDKQFCCKVVNEDASDIAHKMLLNEASRLEISQHPSVAEFIKVGNDFDRPYLMYEWIQGESLAEKMERHFSKGFRNDHIAWLVYQLAGALEFMHTRGICHLDIKPSNILVCDGDYVKLIDFGAARYIGENEHYAEASLRYASPLYLETGTAEPQDDVYSLALLTGHLFLGNAFGETWHKQLLARKCPKLIPTHVWKLIKEVLTKPRGHQYTAISFAQQLAHIDTESIDSNASAPIFSNLRHADLVLTQRKPPSRLGLGRFKAFEAALVICVIAITGNYLYKQSKPDWELYVHRDQAFQSSVATIKPAQTASFITQPPWDIELSLNNIETNVLNTAPYREAYQVQQGILSNLYEDHKATLESYKKIANDLPQNLLRVRREIISLREQLQRDGSISPKSEKALIKTMALINKTSLSSKVLSDYSGDKLKYLTEMILNGESKLAEDGLKEAWFIHQAESYYYNQVLPQKILSNINDSIEQDVRQHYYTKAIAQAEAAKQFFGPTSEIVEKVRNLKIARSEFILFSTVTNQSLFGKQKLQKSLSDLESNAPSKFDEIIEILSGMASDSISKSHQKPGSARGAIAIERAVNDYLSETRG